MRSDATPRGGEVNLAVVIDRDAPAGNVLAPLARLLRQIAEQERQDGAARGPAPRPEARGTASTLINGNGQPT
jgi:hypothetical protein